MFPARLRLILSRGSQRRESSFRTQLIASALAWPVVYLLLLGIFGAFGTLLETRAFSVQLLIVSGIVVLLMANVVMPLLSGFVRSWNGSAGDVFRRAFRRDETDPITASTMPLRAIGMVHSRLTSVKDAPKMGSEGAPAAWVYVDPRYVDALLGVIQGEEVLLLTWLHKGRRDVLQVHPRGDPSNPLAGVFATRSPWRPNPIGLHRVRVLEIADRTRLRVAPLDAIDGTPVIDIKPILQSSADA